MYDLKYLDCFEECIDNNTPIAWLPHGGIEDKSSEAVEKEYDIIIASSISDYVAFENELLQLEAGVVKNFANNLHARGRQNYNVPLYSHFKEELETLGIETQYLRNDEGYLKVFSFVYKSVDRILRSRF